LKGEVVEHDDGSATTIVSIYVVFFLSQFLFSGVARQYTAAAAVPKSKEAVRAALAAGEREEVIIFKMLNLFVCLLLLSYLFFLFKLLFIVKCIFPLLKN
jgi:hypothetical protein